ncbi:unnamed protein product [Echinostoma caproni]|uniref:WH2 domain-containing protein n=1 Tax=Echinostoma caproni TaxID=27848 RepID=A0A183B3J1_9TREM|nr:unnamed protein product [Echinostoma caproni]
MLASQERGSVSIKSSSSSATSSKPVSSVRLKKDPIPKATADGKPVRIGTRDKSDSYSLSSVDVMDSNDMKYMDDSTSSSSTSSISGGVDLGSSSASTASASPTTAQSSHSQDTLKFDTRSPLACPLSNGLSGPSNSNSVSSRSVPTSLVNGQQTNAVRYSAPIHRPTYMPKPSRIPVLTSLGRIKPLDIRNGSENRPHPHPSGNDGTGPGNHSPTNSPASSSPRTPVRLNEVDHNGMDSSESTVEPDDWYSQKVTDTPK